MSRLKVFASLSFFLIFLSICHGQTLIQDARQSFKKGEYHRAISLLQSSLSIEQTAEAYYGLGLCYIELGDLDKALNVFDKAVDIDKSFIEAYDLLLQKYYRNFASPYRDADKAILVLKKAIKVNPNYALAYFWLGEEFWFKGSMMSFKAGVSSEDADKIMRRFQVQAEHSLLRAIILDPSIAKAYVLLGEVYGTWGNFDLAILQFQKAVEQKPSHYDAWWHLGYDYLRLKRYQEAIDALKRAEKSSSASIRNKAVDALATAYEKVGDTASAQKYKKLSSDPTRFYQSYIRLAEIFAAKGDTALAREYRQMAEEIAKK